VVEFDLTDIVVGDRFHLEYLLLVNEDNMEGVDNEFEVQDVGDQ